MKDLPTLVAVTAGLAFAAASTTPPLAAAPGAEAAPPIAGERLLGTVLRIEPRLDYESASLRIAGPGGYVLSKRFAAGEPIDVDLLADAEPREEWLRQLPGTSELSGLQESAAPRDSTQPGTVPWSALPEGKYRYEVDFVQQGATVRVHRGRFYAQAGAAASRQASPIPPERSSDVSSQGTPTSADLASGMASETGESLAESDFILISDAANDGLTWFGLDSDNSSGTLLERWALVNRSGDLTIEECGSSSPSASCQQTQIVILEDTDTPRIGIGTTAPQQEFHVHSSDGGDILLTGGAPLDRSAMRFQTPRGGELLFDDTSTAGADWVVGGEEGFFSIYHSPIGQYRFLASETGVAIGHSAPQAMLHVSGDTRVDGNVRMGSSRTLKTGFDPVSPTEVLAKLADLPVTSWRYKTEDEASRHIGPVAEDFQRLFGLGDGETISVVDAQGVALAAIQGLQGHQQGVDAELRHLRTRNQELTQRLSALEETLAALVSERDQAEDGEATEIGIQ